MTDGYENREALIRDHWKRYGYRWDIAAIGPRLTIPVRHRVHPLLPRDDEALLDVQNPTIDKLTFAFERGELNCRPAYRVTCEGIVVEEGLL